MQAFTHFSAHAFERVAQRTKLRSEDIATLLDKKLAVDMGHKPGFNRHHLVFYSIPDDNFFVAIQDKMTGTVVTVLPLDYHASLAWGVSSEDCEKAKLLQTPPVKNKSMSPAPQVIASKFVIKSHFEDDAGNRKTKVVHRIESQLYGNDMNSFLADREISSVVKESCMENGIDLSRVYGVTVSLGNGGDPVHLDFDWYH